MQSYDVELAVTLRLDADLPHPIERIETAVEQAVSNALQFAYENGFQHCLSDELSIGVRDVAKVFVFPCNNDPL